MAEGDAAALKAFYELNAPWVCALVQRILGDNRDSHDALQETFIKAWRQASRYRSERGSTGAWLTFIARNIAVDTLRKRRRAAALLAPSELARDVAVLPEAGPDEDLTGALGGLNELQRRALELSFYEGWSPAEVAQRMGLSVGGAKNHLRRGLARLRETFKRHE